MPLANGNIQREYYQLLLGQLPIIPLFIQYLTKTAPCVFSHPFLIELSMPYRHSRIIRVILLFVLVSATYCLILFCKHILRVLKYDALIQR